MLDEKMAKDSTVYTMSEGVPIFLKKTYHMIDSCDSDIAGWDEDGLTFTVKDPNLFESKVIPQFFKHSKFSSFVRQLNFYSFRKIKYGDSIRIDLETEKRTANYWRFKHENFRQGRPDLLSDIKRMNGKNAVVDSSNIALSVIPSAVPSSVLSSPTTKLDPSQVPLSSVLGSSIQVAEKSEVLKLKKRIDEMTKNIDKLTEMVQKVTLHQQSGEDLVDQSVVPPGSKRKKTPQQTDFAPNDSRSAVVAFPDLPMPDGAFSTSMMDIDELMSPDHVSSATEFLQVPPLAPSSRESSSTDADFVDQLFTAFNDDDDVTDWFASHNKNTESFNTSVKDGDEFLVSTTNQTNNRPNPELMQRLSDALQLLPRDIQELIVNRLIDAITSSEGFTVPPPIENATAATTSSVAPTRIAAPQVLAPPKLVDTEQPKKATYVANSKSLPEQQQQIQPLAAATLAALLHHYSNQIKVGSQQQQDETAASESKKNIKTLPVIQVHA